jgi:hypothetical protein
MRRERVNPPSVNSRSASDGACVWLVWSALPTVLYYLDPRSTPDRQTPDRRRDYPLLRACR